MVQLNVIEGYVEDVTLTGDGAGKLVKAYAAKLKQGLPLKRSRLERYLSLMRDVPGVKIDVQLLQGSKPGAVVLAITAHQKRVEAGLSLNNRGTAYLGQNQIRADLYVDRLPRQGDQLRLTYATPTDTARFQYYSAGQTFALGQEGANLGLSGGYIITHPAFSPDRGPRQHLGPAGFLSRDPRLPEEPLHHRRPRRVGQLQCRLWPDPVHRARAHRPRGGLLHRADSDPGLFPEWSAQRRSPGPGRAERHPRLVHARLRQVQWRRQVQPRYRQALGHAPGHRRPGHRQQTAGLRTVQPGRRGIRDAPFQPPPPSATRAWPGRRNWPSARRARPRCSTDRNSTPSPMAAKWPGAPARSWVAIPTASPRRAPERASRSCPRVSSRSRRPTRSRRPILPPPTAGG
ncbi:MAG: hypothetical protein WDN45_09770 [Caulobacteraceae bacterium]